MPDDTLTLIARLHTALTGQATTIHACAVMWGGHLRPIGWAGGAGPTDRPWPVVLDAAGDRQIVPDYTTYAGMGLVIDALKAKDWCVAMSFDPSGYGVIIHEFWNGQVLGDAVGQSLPLAVARAAMEALEGKENKG